jgi:hypothetical protein
LASRVDELQRVLDPIAQNSRTSAVLALRSGHPGVRGPGDAAGSTAKQQGESLLGAGVIQGGILTGGLPDALGTAVGGDETIAAGEDATAEADADPVNCDSFTPDTKVLLAALFRVPFDLWDLDFFVSEVERVL